MNVKLRDIIQVSLAMLLFVAATTTRDYNFYVFLRWAVFLVSLFVAYKFKDRMVAVILVLAFGILFNPILPFRFKKETWHIIDFLLAILLILTINWKSYTESFSPIGRLRYNLIRKTVFGGLAIIAAGYFVVFLIGGNPYHEYLLLNNGTSVQGYITDITEDIEERDAGGNDYYYDISFYFNLENGEQKECFQTTHELSRQSIPDLSKPHPIDVVYLKSNPDIYKLKYTVSESKTEFLWRKIGGGTLMLLLFGSIGFTIIRGAVIRYKTEKGNEALSQPPKK